VHDSSNDHRIRVFIVDDHHVVRQGLQMMLRHETDMAVVGTASTAAEALELLPKLSVDVLLTDLRMPVMNGDALVRELRKRQPSLKAVALTNYHSDEDVFRAVDAGATAFVRKSATMETVLHAIRTVSHGEQWIPAAISEQIRQRAARLQLSPRENEILQLMAQGYRNREIARQLTISENTVRNHVFNLLEKLGTTHRTEAIATAVQQGLVQMDGG
jgi:two-component system, NarL family, response regulator